MFSCRGMVVPWLTAVAVSQSSFTLHLAAPLMLTRCFGEAEVLVTDARMGSARRHGGHVSAGFSAEVSPQYLKSLSQCFASQCWSVLIVSTQDDSHSHSHSLRSCSCSLARSTRVHTINNRVQYELLGLFG